MPPSLPPHTVHHQHLSTSSHLPPLPTPTRHSTYRTDFNTTSTPPGYGNPFRPCPPVAMMSPTHRTTPQLVTFEHGHGYHHHQHHSHHQQLHTPSTPHHQHHQQQVSSSPAYSSHEQRHSNLKSASGRGTEAGADEPKFRRDDVKQMLAQLSKLGWQPSSSPQATSHPPRNHHRARSNSPPKTYTSSVSASSGGSLPLSAMSPSFSSSSRLGPTASAPAALGRHPLGLKETPDKASSVSVAHSSSSSMSPIVIPTSSTTRPRARSITFSTPPMPSLIDAASMSFTSSPASSLTPSASSSCSSSPIYPRTPPSYNNHAFASPPPPGILVNRRASIPPQTSKTALTMPVPKNQQLHARRVSLGSWELGDVREEREREEEEGGGEKVFG